MTDDSAWSAWNPGLESDIPRALWPQVTLFREENAFVSYKQATELADLTGLKAINLAAFRPERLVQHALLVRVTADLSVPDGPSYEELGLNIRGMVDTIYTQFMLPDMGRIVAVFSEQKILATDFIANQLSSSIFERPPDKPTATEKPSLFRRLFGKPDKRTVSTTSTESIELQAIAHFKKRLDTENDPLHNACLHALVKVVGAIVGHRGRLPPNAELVSNIVVNQVCNTHGAIVVNNAIDSLWSDAVDQLGYRRLPAQSKPVVMNVKGASASGKSTIRPQQRQLAGKLGVPWEDFALISPDYWRKYLLDYDSLGAEHKYAAMLTGRELEIIDKKLDNHMAIKASSGMMSHLLIDRFRFDSFTLDIDRTADSKLLSRFGDRVYLFFLITNPVETVERAWLRGLKTGRYKAVDDLLYHNIEAYTGMPSLFLSWVNSRDRQIHFEFLDNNVPEGQLPKTAAFGSNNSMTILDLEPLLDIDRYRNVRIEAVSPEDVFDESGASGIDGKGFIFRCAEKVAEINFADQASTEMYANANNGTLVWWDHDYISRHIVNKRSVETLKALGYTGMAFTGEAQMQPSALDAEIEQRATVGQWGDA